MKHCHRCTLARWAERAKKKMQEWAAVPAIANTHRRRLHELEHEIATLDKCECKKTEE
jgi:hypothetical protein